MMSKTKNDELKFSIRNLIDTKPCIKKEKRISKRLIIESQTPLIRRPIPIINDKISHPCWSFLTQIANKNYTENLSLHSSFIFLSKLNQAWEHIQRTQISPSIITENDNVSEDDDTDMDTSSIRHNIEIEDDEEKEEEEDVDDDDDDDDLGECSSSNDDDKINPLSNNEENDKLKNYPCTQCGKVK
ncbi:unnamed protein product [Rotaria sp. Silwood1]|nr:unnamed protein product [Rotaria sp. Silwood1]